MKHRIIKLSLVLAIIAAAVCGVAYWQQMNGPASGPPPAEAAPTIRWTPGSVSEIVGQGQTKTIQVAFTASENAKNVAVRIVPELQPFVQVTPTSFPSITRGQTLTLDITFAASETAPLGTATGTIRLGTFARPLPVVLDVWNHFVDPDGHYSILLPPDVDVFQSDSGLEVFRPEADLAEEGPAIRLRVDANPTGMAPQDYYDGDPSLDLFSEFNTGSEVAEVVVDGVPSVRVVPVVTLGGSVVVIVPLGPKFLRIEDDGATYQENNLFDKILSTIELTQN